MAAAESGRCDGYSDDTGSLAAARSTMKVPNDWVVLPEVISKEPLGIHSRDGDDRWVDILRWVHHFLLNAEEFGVTQANVDQMKSVAGPVRPPAARAGGRFRQAARPRQRVRLPRDQGGGELRRGLRPLLRAQGALAAARRRTTSGPRAACSTACRCAERRGRGRMRRRSGSRVRPRPRPPGAPGGRGRGRRRLLLAQRGREPRAPLDHLRLRVPLADRRVRYPVPRRPVERDRHLRPRAVGLVPQHAARLRDGHRRGDPARARARDHAAVANWLVRNIALGIIELVRNTPQLVQIVFWYVAVLQSLPGPRNSLELGAGVLLNVRGLFLPAPLLGPAASSRSPPSRSPRSRRRSCDGAGWAAGGSAGARRCRCCSRPSGSRSRSRVPISRGCRASTSAAAWRSRRNWWRSGSASRSTPRPSSPRSSAARSRAWRRASTRRREPRADARGRRCRW